METERETRYETIRSLMEAGLINTNRLERLMEKSYKRMLNLFDNRLSDKQKRILESAAGSTHPIGTLSVFALNSVGVDHKSLMMDIVFEGKGYIENLHLEKHIDFDGNPIEDKKEIT